MKTVITLQAVLVALVLSVAGCTDKGKELFSHAGEDLEGVKTLTGVTVDRNDCFEGTGCLKIESESGRTVRLFETGDVDVEDARLLYSARLRSRDLTGEAYLEMLVNIPGRGKFFSKGLDQKLTGTTEWVEVTIPFFLKSGQDPDNIQLNVVIQGKGTVWADDIKLKSAPL